MGEKKLPLAEDKGAPAEATDKHIRRKRKPKDTKMSAARAAKRQKAAKRKAEMAERPRDRNGRLLLTESETQAMLKERYGVRPMDDGDDLAREDDEAPWLDPENDAVFTGMPDA